MFPRFDRPFVSIPTALILMLAAVLGSSLTARPAAAIINGHPDGDRHPYVGLVTNGTAQCSGALLSPTVFLTAAHCFATPGATVLVTFAETVRGEQPPAVFGGRWYPDPQFCLGCAPGLPGFDTQDVGIVVLDTPVPTSIVPSYGRLPTLGQTDRLRVGTELSVVGYGAQVVARGDGPPRPVTSLARYAAAALLGRSGQPYHTEFVKVSANPAQGGGTCFGDSGGPALLGETATILAVTSFGTNGVCAGVGYYYRIDTPAALAFITSYLQPTGRRAPGA